MPVNTADLSPGGGGGNNPGGLAALSSFGFMSSSTSGSATHPIYSFSDDSLGFFESGASTIAQSYGTLNLFSQAVRFSMATAANATGLNIGELKIVFAASGISLVYSSGASYYIIGGSATSAVQS